MERILVTGGSGFIGANLIPELEAEGYQVTILDNFSRGDRTYVDHTHAAVVSGDIRRRDDVDKAMSGADRVVHLAAYGSVVESVDEPLENFEVNALGTLRVLESASRHNVDRLVFASTGGALIGDASPPVDEESVPRPKSPYGASKLAGEGYCHAYAGSHGLSTVMLRFGNVYGPVSAHKKGAITAFSKALLQNLPLTIYGDGSASRDFLYVTDLCDGIRRALSVDVPNGATFHLARGEEVTIGSLARLLCDIAGKPDHPIEFRASRPGEVHRNFASFERAQEVLGFEPRVGLDEGLRATWSWFAEQRERAVAAAASDS